MEQFLCIHGHFYQPPRENPWLEAIEIQDSAHPYHDWNERVTAECYAPNTAARRLDGERRILGIVSNYTRISFNFGPTLLSWMEAYSPEVYRAIIEADRQSVTRRSGHGNALAQVYNHVIMPLATARDKRTQVLWGIRDFEHRFGRFPEGMWLAETAVDLETLEVLAEAGIAFTILAQHQARRVRPIGAGRWKDVAGGRIDPSRAYLCRLPSGRRITLFFYDGPISRGVAFEKLLDRGEDFARRLLEGYSRQRDWPQLLSIATDGETYGHHHPFGEMALSYALDHLEENGLARLTNFGEYLERHPPTHEVHIVEETSWSCSHGIERWRSACGCNSGGRPGWNQKWRGPLRAAMDWLGAELAARYEKGAGKCLREPWRARDDYADIILDRRPESVAAFLRKHALRNLEDEEAVAVLSLLEMQRHALLMFTSCGWFFDEISGIETVQVLQYAGRAIQLAEKCSRPGIEKAFTEQLAAAPGNLPDHPDGASVYEAFVKPAMVNLIKVGAHYAVSSLFEEYGDTTRIFTYRAAREDFHLLRAGQTKLAIGRIDIRSTITRYANRLSFCALHFGNHALYCGVRSFIDATAYRTMREEIGRSFEQSDFAGIIRLMDAHFGMHNYSLRDLFRDEQRRILQRIIGTSLIDFEDAYQRLYRNNRILMRFLQETGMPLPHPFRTTAEIALNLDLRQAFAEDPVDMERVKGLVAEIEEWRVQVDAVDLEFHLRRKLEKAMAGLADTPEDAVRLAKVRDLAETVTALPVAVNLWQVQNIYWQMTRTVYPGLAARAVSGDGSAAAWTEAFRDLGRLLYFNVPAILPEPAEG